MKSKDCRYLLRLWREAGDEGTWRASLRDLVSDETRYFGSLGQLTEHLTTLTSKRDGGKPE